MESTFESGFFGFNLNPVSDLHHSVFPLMISEIGIFMLNAFTLINPGLPKLTTSYAAFVGDPSLSKRIWVITPLVFS